MLRIRKKHIILCTLIFLSLGIFASIRDTVRIENVIINRKKIADISGFKRTKIDEKVMEQNTVSDLGQIISENTPLHIKSYGQGATATASFRGTNATHTQVNWNGILLNSITLGQFDFSLISAFFIDDLSLNYGAGSLKNSSGGFGGSVNISNAPRWNSTIKNKFAISYGNNKTLSAFAYDISEVGNFLFKTRFYTKQSDNNFKYNNNVYAKEPIIEKRKNAFYKNSGFLEEIYYRINTYNFLNLNIWVQNNYRELPSNFVIGNDISKEDMNNFNIRTILNFKGQSDKLFYTNSVAYIFENMEYNKKYNSPNKSDKEDKTKDEPNIFNILSINKCNSLIYKADLTYKLNKNVSFSTGINNKYDFLYSENYTNNFTSRNISSLYLSSEYNFNERIMFSGLLRGNLIDKKFSRVLFSFGANYRIIEDQDYFIKFNVARNSHEPTFNALYYKPSGNPDLLAENGFSYETSFVATKRLSNSLNIDFDFTYYFMDIKDWIIWLPTDSFMWSPVNYKKVQSQGIEILTKIQYNFLDFTNKLILNYSYTSSINKTKSNNKNDNSREKQLIYIPKNKFNLRYIIGYKNLEVSYNVNFIGKRFTSSDNERYITGYIIHDANINYKFNIWNKDMALKCKLDNLINTFYYSIEFYPMPLRQWELIYSIKF